MCPPAQNASFLPSSQPGSPGTQSLSVSFSHPQFFREAEISTHHSHLGSFAYCCQGQPFHLPNSTHTGPGSCSAESSLALTSPAGSYPCTTGLLLGSCMRTLVPLMHMRAPVKDVLPISELLCRLCTRPSHPPCHHRGLCSGLCVLHRSHLPVEYVPLFPACLAQARADYTQLEPTLAMQLDANPSNRQMSPEL